MSKRAEPEDFWKHVDKSGECWLWLGGKSGCGYGSLTYQGKVYRAHRLAWILTNGTIPLQEYPHSREPYLVLHRCDNPICVRPDHLFLGSDRDNVHDKLKKKRGHDQSGEKNPNWKGGFDLPAYHRMWRLKRKLKNANR